MLLVPPLSYSPIKYYLYDESKNFIGEYDNGGTTVSEHIYLNGQVVGLVKDNQLYYVHTDQIGTPRLITNTSNGIVWKWSNSDPFGRNLPNIQTIEYNKRFAGQYFDKESNLHYNYHRTYNPTTGRYIQSDPIGLAAGFNTYNYVQGNPLGYVDSLGLRTVDYGTYTKTSLAHWPFLRLEAYVKSFDNDPSFLRLLSHGSVNTLSGFSEEKLAKQITGGIFITPSGKYNDNYFKEQIAKNKDILIKLDACDTGAYYVEELSENGKIISSTPHVSFANGVGRLLRKEANNDKKYTGKIRIQAPNGAAVWAFGLDYVSTPEYGKDMNGNKGKINEFIF